MIPKMPDSQARSASGLTCRADRREWIRKPRHHQVDTVCVSFDAAAQVLWSDALAAPPPPCCEI